MVDAMKRERLIEDDTASKRSKMEQSILPAGHLIHDVLCHVLRFTPNHLQLRLVSHDWDACIQSIHSRPHDACTTCWARSTLEWNAARMRHRLPFMTQWVLTLPSSSYYPPEKYPPFASICDAFVRDSPIPEAEPPQQPQIGPQTATSSSWLSFPLYALSSLKSIVSSLFWPKPRLPYVPDAIEYTPQPSFPPLNHVSIGQPVSPFLHEIVSSALVSSITHCSFGTLSGLIRDPSGQTPSIQKLRFLEAICLLTNLQFVSFQFFDLNSSELKSILKSMRLLSSLSLDCCCIPNNCIPVISSLAPTTLTSLSLLNNLFSSEEFSASFSVPTLKHLSLSFVEPEFPLPFVNCEEYKAYKHICIASSFPELTSLEMPKLQIFEEPELPPLFRLRNLTRFICQALPSSMLLDILLSDIHFINLEHLEVLLRIDTCLTLIKNHPIPSSVVKRKLRTLKLKMAFRQETEPYTGDNGDDILRILTAIPSTAMRLKELDLNNVSDDGLAFLSSSSSCLDSLTSLSLSNFLDEKNVITEKGVGSLCTSPFMSRLVHLSICGTHSNPWVTRLEQYDSDRDLERNEFLDDSCAQILAACAALTNLEKLTLYGNNFSMVEGILPLVESPYLTQLLELCCFDSDYSAREEWSSSLRGAEKNMAMECAERMRRSLQTNVKKLRVLTMPDTKMCHAVGNILHSEYREFFGDY